MRERLLNRPQTAKVTAMSNKRPSSSYSKISFGKLLFCMFFLNIERYK